MAKDQRKKDRRPVSAVAYVYTIDGWPVAECKTQDVSETGAKLIWTSSEEVPSEFLLSLSRDGKVRRRCLVKWREADKIGVKFVAS
jgi:hypothetical protein